MSNRLTQIATRTGDDGTTGLGDGQRVAKDHLRIQAMGDVDELNSQLGVLLAEPLPDEVRELLVVIQHELFNLGGELSIPGFALLKAEAVRASRRGAGAGQCAAAAAARIHPAGGHPQRGDRPCRANRRAARRALGGRAGQWPAAPRPTTAMHRRYRRCAPSRASI